MHALVISFNITAKEVKDMAKYLVLWRLSPTAPWPTDPAEVIKLHEMLYAAADNLIKAGVIKEHGFFIAGGGYTIYEIESLEAFRVGQMWLPFVEAVKVEEIVPYESGKKIAREAWTAKAEAMKKKSFGYTFGYTYFTETIRA
jgi:hypothetical protein